MHAEDLRRLRADTALSALGLVPELATEDLVLLHYRGGLFALASIIEIKSWEPSARTTTQRRLPFLFELGNPANGTALRPANFDFTFWEKNWMPFVRAAGHFLTLSLRLTTADLGYF
jgi:hypothetical protein